MWTMILSALALGAVLEVAHRCHERLTRLPWRRSIHTRETKIAFRERRR